MQRATKHHTLFPSHLVKRKKKKPKHQTVSHFQLPGNSKQYWKLGRFKRLYTNSC